MHGKFKEILKERYFKKDQTNYHLANIQVFCKHLQSASTNFILTVRFQTLF